MTFFHAGVKLTHSFSFTLSVLSQICIEKYVFFSREKNDSLFDLTIDIIVYNYNCMGIEKIVTNMLFAIYFQPYTLLYARNCVVFKLSIRIYTPCVL